MFTGNIVQEKRWVIPSNGSTQNPGLSFFSGKHSGFSKSSNDVDVSIQGTNIASMQSTGFTVFGTIDAHQFIGNGGDFTSANTLTISNIQIANSSYDIQDDTAASTETGGFLVINGTNFGPGTSVTIGGTQALSVSFVSTSKLHVQIPAKSSGSYNVVATRADGKIAMVPLGVTYSPFPVWSTVALANVTKTVEFSQTISATESSGSNVTYQLATGSSLPANVTLTSNGILSGNIVTDVGNTTTYSFGIDAIDAQYQNIPKVFSFVASSPIITSGGTVTNVSGYTIHTFTSSSTFTISSNPEGKTFQIIIVGGGGGGGLVSAGGGSGGRVIYYDAYALSNQTYTITIGNGGSTGNGGSGSQGQYSGYPGGSSSIVGTGVSLTATGGIGGLLGAGNNSAATSGKTIEGVATSYTGGTGNSLNAGGRGGGGAGSGANGGNSGTLGGVGGNGVQLNGVYYGGGGGGGADGTSGTLPGMGAGGLGGGGAGGSGATTGSNGQINTGGGGGGGGGNTSQFANDGGAGGSGIVLIRYLR